MRRVNEVLAILIVGDGVIGLMAPRRHMLLWSFGPKGYKKMMQGFAERPGFVKVLAVAEVAGGLWLALRQYREN